jgi:hypothetical protein
MRRGAGSNYINSQRYGIYRRRSQAPLILGAGDAHAGSHGLWRAVNGAAGWPTARREAQIVRRVRGWTYLRGRQIYRMQCGGEIANSPLLRVVRRLPGALD